MDAYVYQPFTLWATGGRIDEHAGFLAYDKASPSEVEIVFPLHDGSGDTTGFKVPRELLAAGLQHCASWGAFIVRPHTVAGWLVVTLPGRGDHYADAVVLKAFLDATAQLAPREVSA